MEIGAHLPLIDFGDGPLSAPDLTSYAARCVDLYYAAIAANDHLVFPLPWLDGLTALAVVAGSSSPLTLATTVALPVVRGPVPLAKTLAAISTLSGGRLVAGVGPGSSRADYAAGGLDFDERWARLDDAVPTMRAVWASRAYGGRFYSTGEGLTASAPSPQGGPPVWLGSWGSAAGLRRVARLADGWLASAYHTTPTAFAAARTRLGHELRANGRTRPDFPNAVATFFFQVTRHRHEAEHLLTQVLAPALDRDPDLLAGRIAIGPPELLSERLAALEAAGAHRVYLWPLSDPHHQLELARQAWPG